MQEDRATRKPLLSISLLGHISLSAGEVVIAESSSRSQQTWLMFSYLACNRNRLVRPDELMRLLGANQGSDNSAGALKTAVWRMRKTVKPLSDELGMDIVVSKDGMYQLNPNACMTLDIEVVEGLLTRARRAINDRERLDAFCEAFELHGEKRFLEKFAGNIWVDTLAAHYERLISEAALEALPLMLERGEALQAERLSRYALSLMPYDEPIFRQLLASLVAQGKYETAAEEYDSLCDFLFVELGAAPEMETQAIYHEVLGHITEQGLSLEQIASDLGEQGPVEGPLLCDYARFKLYYQAEARSASRRGESINIGLLTVKGKRRKKLSAHGLETTMGALRESICAGLRMGDVVAECSPSQFIFMLVHANYESSLKVCQRLVDAFEASHPRSPAQISATVLPFDPPDPPESSGSDAPPRSAPGGF